MVSLNLHPSFERGRATQIDRIAYVVVSFLPLQFAGCFCACFLVRGWGGVEFGGRLGQSPADEKESSSVAGSLAAVLSRRALVDTLEKIRGRMDRATNLHVQGGREPDGWQPERRHASLTRFLGLFRHARAEEGFVEWKRWSKATKRHAVLKSTPAKALFDFADAAWVDKARYGFRSANWRTISLENREQPRGVGSRLAINMIQELSAGGRCGAGFPGADVGNKQR